MHLAFHEPPRGEAVRKSLTRIPPPLAFAVPIVLGLLVNQWIPLRIVPSSVERMAILAGVTLLGIGLALAATCLAMFVRRRTTIFPHGNATALVTSGPYRLTRNPMYVSFTCISVGVAVATNVLWSLFLLPLPLLLVAAVHIPVEEGALCTTFGEEYRLYARRVRRWL